MEPSVGWLSVVVLVLCVGTGAGDRGDHVGCYRLKEGVLNTHTGPSVDVCLTACEQVYYKYALIGNESTCFCDNSAGTFMLAPESCDSPCPKNETQKCGGVNAVSVYDTGVFAPGPPEPLNVTKVTETTVRISWKHPEAFSKITGYVVRANIIETYAEITFNPPEWSVSNNTFNLELPNLHPGSNYLISVAGTNGEEEGPKVTTRVETIIGTPDPSPPDIEVLERHGNKMLVHIPKAKNVNGPISMYQVVVSVELYQQGILPDSLGNYSYARSMDIPYYITAELAPDEIKNDFIIGDEHIYNGFYNAPLPLTNDIEVSLGIISEKNNARKVRYAESTKKIILNINEPEDVNPMVLGLGAGIAIGVVLLLIGVGMIIVLRKRIHLVRQRGSQSMPLSLSEPCVEIENSGFLIDDDEKVDYYGNLKRKLWNIPRNLIDIDISCVVGVGSYGKFTKAKVQQHGGQTPGLVQVINDREMEKPDKKLMLQELDLLIKSSEHENVVSLIGICETNTSLFVVLQDSSCTLKEMLLQSRQRDLQNNKFSMLTENRVLQLCADVAAGLEYLHSKSILHKRLSCRNVVIGVDGAARVGGFGLAHVRPPHETPDYTRWMACEMLRQARVGPKADVWAFGCTVWEALTLGGTPYASTASADVAARVLRGMRAPQPGHVGDELFALCLQCWQLDADERPAAPALTRALRPLAAAPGTRSLSFTHYNGFEYEPHIHQYEII